jgi:glutamyl-tRNA synthetase
MLAVVVDDHDMDVTHVIRGDDHLTNAARQQMVYDAMGWAVPVWAHIPLIHGPDGKKLSKRHGADGLQEYQAMGYPASAMRNYLCRLGWAHGDDEIFTRREAMEMVRPEWESVCARRGWISRSWKTLSASTSPMLTDAANAA